MKIAVFTNTYIPAVNGVVKCVSLLKNNMERKGHKVCIFAPDYLDYEDDDTNIYRYKSVEMSHKVNYPLAIRVSPKAASKIKKFRPDIIHTHHPFLLGKSAYYYSKKFNVPLVFTFHTQYDSYLHYIPLPEDLVKYFSWSIVLKFIQKCDYVTTPAESIRDMLMDKFDVTKRIDVIPNGIDTEQFSKVNSKDITSIKEKYGITDEKIVLYVGRIAKEKNLEFLLSAFKMFNNKIDKKTKLLIAGSGPELENIKQTASKLKIRDNVIFTGNVDYHKLPALYKTAHIFATASTTEVKPLVLLEALAAGLPIVGVKASGVIDTITDGKDGVIVENNEKAFAHGLYSVFSNESLSKKLKKGAAKTAELYNIERIANLFENLYIEAVSSNSENNFKSIKNSNHGSQC